MSETEQCPQCGRESLYLGSYTCVCGNCGYSILASKHQVFLSPLRDNNSITSPEEKRKLPTNQ